MENNISYTALAFYQLKICLYKRIRADGRIGIVLTITQENLIRDVANREDIDVATVRKIFKTTEKCIFDYLSSTTPTENTVVKLLDGLSLECTYIPERELHTYKDLICEPRIKVHPKVTRYYNRKLNGYF